MKDRHYAHLNEESVAEIWRRICRIRQLDQDRRDWKSNPVRGPRPAKCNDTQGKIALDFSVSKKTINRIASGETWGDVTEKIEAEKRAVNPDIIPAVPSISEKDLDLHATMTGHINSMTTEKGHFLLDHEKPLHWGWYEAWDGLHPVASDTIICWESAKLNDLARKISELRSASFREWLQLERPDLFELILQAKELPTFYLSESFGRSVGDKYHYFYDEDRSYAILTKGDLSTYIGASYAKFAFDNGYEIRVAGDKTDIVYLTKRPAPSKDPVVHAILSTMKLESK